MPATGDALWALAVALAFFIGVYIGWLKGRG